MNHIGEDAELYALGMLSDFETAQIRQHIGACSACRTSVSRAADVIAALAAETPQLEPGIALRARLLKDAGLGTPKGRKTSWKWFAAGAFAGIAAAALVFLPMRASQDRIAAQNDLAFSTLVGSHFNHVQFAPATADAPRGKVLYGRHGEWVYVIVHAPRSGTEVALVRATGRTMLGSLLASGSNDTIFKANPGRFISIELVANGKVIAQAVPVFAR